MSKMKEQNTKDLKNIMGVEETAIELLPALYDNWIILNCLARQLPGILRGLKLKNGQVVLDLPCGKGGVSVPLAKKYRVKVCGFDILKGYVDFANQYAKKQRVEKLCEFKVGDIRDVVKRKNICDVLLWIAPPHVFGKAEPTMKILRNCVKNGGTILVYDAYLTQKPPKNLFQDYDSLAQANAGFTAFDDKIIKIYDYKKQLWGDDYKKCRKSVEFAIEKSKDIKERNILKKHLLQLNKDEKNDTEYLGVAVWIIRVNKP